MEPSLLSALSFCESSKSQLILSDNSYDQRKEKALNSFKLSYFKHLKGPKVGIDNWQNAVNQSQSLYTLILCDDDMIFNLSKPKFDYEEAKKNNIVGIKPILSLWNKNCGIYRNNIFHLDSNDPLERVLSYRKNNSGDNTSMYSFYDTKILKDLLSVFLFHPTRGGYTDWAFMLALASSGKIIHSPTDLLIYKNNNWFGTRSSLIKKEAALYEEAGIGKRGILYSFLFRALDAFILISRHNSPVNRKLLIETSKSVLKFNLKTFLNYFKKNKNYYNIKEISVISKINIEKDMNTLFNYLLDVLNIFDQNLKDKYEYFYLNAIGEQWGVIN
jgi:hypothetical protein